MSVVRLDRDMAEMAVTLTKIQDQLAEFLAGGAEIARMAGQLAARGSMLPEVGELRQAIAEVLEFAVERFAHGGNARTNEAET